MKLFTIGNILYTCSQSSLPTFNAISVFSVVACVTLQHGPFAASPRNWIKVFEWFIMRWNEYNFPICYGMV